MSLILGLAAFGNDTHFRSPTVAVRDITYLEMKNSIVDEVAIRERTDILNSTVNNSFNKEDLSMGSLDGLEDI